MVPCTMYYSRNKKNKYYILIQSLSVLQRQPSPCVELLLSPYLSMKNLLFAVCNPPRTKDSMKQSQPRARPAKSKGQLGQVLERSTNDA